MDLKETKPIKKIASLRDVLEFTRTRHRTSSAAVEILTHVPIRFSTNFGSTGLQITVKLSLSAHSINKIASQGSFVPFSFFICRRKNVNELLSTRNVYALLKIQQKKTRKVN